MRPSTLLPPLLVAGLIAGVLWVVGLDLTHALIIGGAAVVLLRLRQLPEADVDPLDVWPERRDDPTTEGVRREVARLSWGMQGIESRVAHRPVTRLQQTARRRLSAHGLDLDDPADADRVRELVGVDPYEVLSSTQNFRPTFAQFARAVSAVERLVPTDPAHQEASR